MCMFVTFCAIENIFVIFGVQPAQTIQSHLGKHRYNNAICNLTATWNCFVVFKSTLFAHLRKVLQFVS